MSNFKQNKNHVYFTSRRNPWTPKATLANVAKKSSLTPKLLHIALDESHACTFKEK